uniref:Uncharacterized protein n=1 Tax=Noccaea caerulescens TaxID=107243 RepID=A0A1J3ELI7_NOCCA
MKRSPMRKNCMSSAASDSSNDMITQGIDKRQVCIETPSFGSLTFRTVHFPGGEIVANGYVLHPLQILIRFIA